MLPQEFVLVFSRLSSGQKAAVETIVGAGCNATSAAAFNRKIDDHQWSDLVTMMSGLRSRNYVTPPDQADVRLVGEMTPGLRNAHFMLMLVDREPNAVSTQIFRNALETRCWDRVTETLQQAMRGKTELSFTGYDLHKAYAPEDDLPCNGEQATILALGKVLEDGKLAGSFFSVSLAKFFADSSLIVRAEGASPLLVGSAPSPDNVVDAAATIGGKAGGQPGGALDPTVW